MAGHSIVLKRVHDEAREAKNSEGAPTRGERFLVDGIWPRGVSKAALEGVSWVKEVAPSGGLRSWFGHDPARFTEFADNYRAELDELDEKNPEALTSILSAVEQGPITLLYAAKDTEHNHAIVLRDWLRDHLADGGN